MKDPKIKVKVKHSESKTAWNIIGTMLGDKYKIARIPYVKEEGNDWEKHNTKQKEKALNQAEFIAYCFNNSTKILNKN